MSTASLASRRLGRRFGTTSIVPWQVAVPAVIVFGLLWVLPELHDFGFYYTSLGSLALIYVVAGLGWNILGGFVGQVSFGHAVFFGAGAYVAARSVNRGWPWPVALALGSLAAVGYGLIWGYPTLRLRGPYFCIATIGVGEATRIAVVNWSWFSGGASGYKLPYYTFSPLRDYHGALILAMIAFAVHLVVRRTKFGAGLAAIRGDVEAASAVGVNPARYQVYALAASAALVGLAGGWYGHHQQYVEPNDVFGFELSVALILIPLLGGIGTIWGPMLGAFVYVVVKEFLNTHVRNAGLSYLIYGLIVVVIILAEPLGLVGIGRLIRRKLRRHPYRACM
jgi:branched-chain amino acid transport system permease protein